MQDHWFPEPHIAPDSVPCVCVRVLYVEKEYCGYLCVCSCGCMTCNIKYFQWLIWLEKCYINANHLLCNPFKCLWAGPEVGRGPFGICFSCDHLRLNWPELQLQILKVALAPDLWPGVWLFTVPLFYNDFFTYTTLSSATLRPKFVEADITEMVHFSRASMEQLQQ